MNEFKSSSWLRFMQKFRGNHMSSKPFWTRINRIRQKKKPRSIPDINHNGTVLTTDQDKENAFGDKLFNTFNDDGDNDDFNEPQKNMLTLKFRIISITLRMNPLSFSRLMN